MLNNRPKTVFCDIDGTLIKHRSPSKIASDKNQTELLPSTLDKLNEWDSKGYQIILVSGRKKGLKKKTEKQLSKLGIFYDKLILGIGGGVRVLINDRKSDGTQTAECVNLKRDEGLSSVNI